MKKFLNSKAAAMIAGVLVGTVAGPYVRKVPLLNKLPQVG